MTTPNRPILDVFTDLDGFPTRDLALEHDFLKAAASGRTTLFCYSWTGPVVVLGYAQKTEDIDIEWCRNHGVPVFRRMSGGTGVVHRRDLAVSLFLPGNHHWARKVTGLYRRFLEVLMPALDAVGGKPRVLDQPEPIGRNRSPICFEDQSTDTLVIDRRKVVGCAQARKRDGILIHAAIHLDLDERTYARAFRVPEERIRTHLGNAVERGAPGTITTVLERLMAEALGAELGSHPLPDPVEGEVKKPRRT